MHASPSFRFTICSRCRARSKSLRKLPCCDYVICAACFEQWLMGDIACPRCGVSSDSTPSEPARCGAASAAPLCAKHRKPSDYFCQTCAVGLCGDCLLEQLTASRNDHAGHAVVRVSELIQSAREDLRREIELLRTSLATIDDALEHIRLDAQTSIYLTGDPTGMIYVAFQESRERFENAVAESKAAYTVQLTELQKQASAVQNLVDESELLLTNDDYRTSKKIQTFLERMSGQARSLQEAALPPAPPPIQNEVIPPFETMTIEIQDFPAAVERAAALSSDGPQFIYSETRKLYNGIWRAKIYPAGDGDGLGTHLSVFLELWKSIKVPAQFVYRFAIFHASDPTKSVILDHSSQYHELDSGGWSRAVSLAVLLGDPDFLSGERSTLRFELSVRPESYKVLYEVTASVYDAIKAKHRTLREEIGSDSET
jgi:hypothetical protein